MKPRTEVRFMRIVAMLMMVLTLIGVTAASV